MITPSLIPKTKLVSGGRLNLQEVNNGFGKLEFKIELIAVEEGLEESKSALAVKNVAKSTNLHKTDSGMKFNANNHSEVIKSFSKPQDLSISQSPELKYTLLHCPVEL
jgi:hypothetical protein